MRSTLFFIPHSIGPLTVFGWGWGLIFLLVSLTLIYLAGRKEFDPQDLLTWGILAVGIVFIVPNLETRFDDGTPTGYPVGIPIRGYGVFLMMGVVSGIALIHRRAGTIGLSFDRLLSMAFWTVIGGLGGARLFYVIQKWSELRGQTFAEKIVDAFRFTEGGLVVYGSLFGGVAAIATWCYYRGFRLLQVADVIAPAFLIGLSLGRIGCLLNGCCYGGVCTQPLPTITFPTGSPPYVDQVLNGKLLGLRFDNLSQESLLDVGRSYVIDSVEPESWAAQNELKSGETFKINRVLFYTPPRGSDPAGPTEVDAEWYVDGKPWKPTVPLPNKSLPVHPAQIYASINAALICGVLYFLWPFVKRHGVVIASALVLYGISRIIEEYIRVDEAGQFGTSLSISQWISIFGIVVGSSFLIYARWTNVQCRSDVIKTDSAGSPSVPTSS